MKVTLSIDSKQSIEIGHSDLALIIGWLPDDLPHAILFSRLCDHPSGEVRCAVAGMTCMPIDTLEHLARDASIEVIRQVANNNRVKMFKNRLILDMISRDVSVADAVAENLSWILDEVREEIIQALLLNTDPKVVETTRSFVKEEDERQRRRREAAEEDDEEWAVDPD